MPPLLAGAGTVPPRSLAMLVHAVRTADSMLVWIVWSVVTALANAFAFASRLVAA